MNICVYGASSRSLDAVYYEEAHALGAAIARRGWSLVYGGGAGGVMGALARGTTENGGAVIGVAPRFFSVDGVLYEECTELVYTDTMRQRKQIMEERADAFIMAAGGIGTLEEFFEIFTLKQLGRHAKPVVILNTAGIYDSLVTLLREMTEKRFMSPETMGLLCVAETPEQALDYIAGYTGTAADPEKMKYIVKD